MTSSTTGRVLSRAIAATAVCALACLRLQAAGAQDARGRDAPASPAATGVTAARAPDGRRDPSPAAVAAVARGLNCPVCRGYTLQDCPLAVCEQMRDVIRDRLAAGRSADEIRSEFVESYGPQVLNAPPREGLYATAWLVPLAVVIGLCCAAAALLARGGRDREAVRAEMASASAADPELVTRLARMAEEE